MITLTTAAVNEFKNIITPDTPYVRISIQGGGCSGFSYQFDTASLLSEDDILYSDVLVVDPISNQYMGGAIIDFKQELIGSSFTIDNPNATTTCGCGGSFGV